MTASYIPPIYWLPSETLSEILTLVSTKGIPLVQRDALPWKLALVSKFWRNVVFSTPELWSDIVLQLDPLRATKVDIRADHLIRAWELCLKRSRGHPLSIMIDATSEETMLFVERLIPSLIEHVEQWETMTFGFPFDLLLPFLNPNFHYPHLRYLTVRGRNSMMVAEEPPHHHELFSNAPLLSRVHFHEFAYPPSTLQFSWTRITDLTMFMNEGSVGDLLYILQNTPTLSSLTFSKFLESSSSNKSLNTENRVLKLPHLQKLSWMTYMFNNAPFFDSISTPQLTELEFQCDDDNWDVASIQRFLTRSKCRVTRIRLNGSGPFIASAFLDILPDAEDVRLCSVHGTEHLMHALTINETISCSNPNMKKLVIDSMSMTEDTYDAFTTMVRSRLRGIPDASGIGRCAKLESLHISVHPERYADVGMAPAYEFLQQRLSPEELDLVTYEERKFEEFDERE